MAVYFSIFLVFITILTGIVYFADKFYFAKQRQRSVEHAEEQCVHPLSQETIDTLLAPSAAVETSIEIFPVIAFVLILRSFIYEPFQIPSGSMMPTLRDGDFILVNKFNYGLRDPVIRNKFIEVGLPERGDVAVFKYPNEPQIDYIKRVIGLPGDRIIYRNKALYIKVACKETDTACPDFIQVQQDFRSPSDTAEGSFGISRFTSTMPNKSHDILVDNTKDARVREFCSSSNARPCYQAGTALDEFIVPAGQYFVMGDNRDNSADSRYWGFVPEENLVGEAVAIWMSFDFDRTEDSLLPKWVPTNVRFSRLGAIH